MHCSMLYAKKGGKVVFKETPTHGLIFDLFNDNATFFKILTVEVM